MSDVQLFGDRVRRTAETAGIELTFRSGVWIATDTTTGERASDLTIAGAWASLRHEPIRDVRDRVFQALTNTPPQTDHD